jgi:hypothetical protein
MTEKPPQQSQKSADQQSTSSGSSSSERPVPPKVLKFEELRESDAKDRE